MLLIKNADFVALFDEKDTVLEKASIIIVENQIMAVGEGKDLPQDKAELTKWYDRNRDQFIYKFPQKQDTVQKPLSEIEQESRIIDARGHIVLPGFVNTHHHLYQTMTRNVPAVQDSKLFDWLIYLYEIWRGITPEVIYYSALVGLGELLLSGCTTSTDHLYLYPESYPSGLIDEEIRAADELGIRFHPTRGSMSLGRKDGGLPPNDVVQSEDRILDDSLRVINKYHDPSPFSMRRIALAPCSPFSVTSELMKQTAEISAEKKVKIHTHLAETIDEEQYCMERFSLRPFDYVEKMGWMNERAWFAHCVYLNQDEILRMARQGAGVAHCPASNLRLGSGIAPVPEMVDAGVTVGLGVDGSASNDTSNLLAEVRNCMLVHRIRSGVSSMSARRALRIAIQGGAEVLGWGDVTGRVEPGQAADLIGIDLRQIAYAGSLHDPLAAIVFCGGNNRVSFNIVNGRVVVEGGKLITISEDILVDKANELAHALMVQAQKKESKLKT